MEMKNKTKGFLLFGQRFAFHQVNDIVHSDHADQLRDLYPNIAPADQIPRNHLTFNTPSHLPQDRVSQLTELVRAPSLRASPQLVYNLYMPFNCLRPLAS
jgi:hypothetical protein